MTLLKVDETAWEVAFGGKYHSVFFEPKYLNIVKQAFNYELHYYISYRGNKLVFAAALFSKHEKIVVPDAFTYNAIYIDGSIGDIVYIQIWEELLSLLKTKFKKIALRLPPEITDVRPFIWGGFNIHNSYTYFREVSNMLTNKMLKKIKRIQQDNNLTFVVNNASNEDIDLNLEICFKYDLPKKWYQHYRNLFAELAERGMLKSLCVYHQEKSACTQIAIIDAQNKTLSTISLNELNNRAFVPYLNYEIYNWCANNGIEKVDMVGANDKGIANFKYSFNATLASYFLVNYSCRQTVMASFIRRLKYYLKKILRR